MIIERSPIEHSQPYKIGVTKNILLFVFFFIFFLLSFPNFPLGKQTQSQREPHIYKRGKLNKIELYQI